MSEEQLKAFLEKVKGDTSLQEKLKASADADAVAAIAKEAGFSISADDLSSAGLKSELSEKERELSEEELTGVAGGIGFQHHNDMTPGGYRARGAAYKWILEQITGI